MCRARSVSSTSVSCSFDLTEDSSGWSIHSSGSGYLLSHCWAVSGLWISCTDINNYGGGNHLIVRVAAVCNRAHCESCKVAFRQPAHAFCNVAFCSAGVHMQSDSTLNPEYDHHSKLSSRLGAVMYWETYTIPATPGWALHVRNVLCKGYNLNSGCSECRSW